VRETQRLFGVVEQALMESEYLAGDYSIADITSFPWMRGYERQGLDIEPFPNLKRWLAAIEARPAVQKGLQLLAEVRRSLEQLLSDEEHGILFGDRQYQRC
jgi:GST-like protein